MRWHVRASVHWVEPWWRLSHHPRVEALLAHRVETHARPRRSPVKHHAVHLLLPVELRRHPRPGCPRGLPRCCDVRCRYLLGCGGAIATVGVRFGGAGLLRRPFRASLLRDAIYSVNLEVHTLSPFLRVRHPGTRSSCCIMLAAAMLPTGKQCGGKNQGLRQHCGCTRRFRRTPTS